LVSAIIVAATIALTSHWSIQPVSGRVGAMRLNRWTGEVVWCGFTSTTTVPSYLNCSPTDDWQPATPN
jgi:hypothetical protein